MPAPRGLVQRVDQELHRGGLLPRGAGLLVAVSGGADSVALLRLLHEINRSDYWGWKLVAGHVDHGLRGRASAGDAAFVRKLAKGLGLPYRSARLRLNKKASEDAARQGRMGALALMARELDGVVMAHHAEDQAETVLMRMFRGCGIAGLGSMSAERILKGRGKAGKLLEVPLYRPLLGVRRAELRGYLEQIGQTWREDATNASPRYLRNRVRAEVMPLIEQVWRGAVGALGRLAQVAGQMDRAMNVFAGRLLPDLVRKKGSGRVVLDWNVLRGSPPALVTHILRGIVAGLGGSVEIADFERLTEATRALNKGTGGLRIEMGAGVTISLGSGEVRIEKRPGRKR